MERFWLAHYPAGVPADIDPTQYESLTQLIDDAFSRYADRNAYSSLGKTMTFRQVDDASRAVAAWLQSRGVAKGARVAIMMPNVLQYPIALAGVLRAGCVVVNVNPLYTARELEHQLKDSGAEAMFVLENFAHTLQQVQARTQVKHVVVASMGDMLGVKGVVVNLVVRRVKKLVPPYQLPGSVRFPAMLAEGRRQTFSPVAVARDDLAFLQYTGGTTGLSKGAMLLHRNVVANVLQSEAWLQPALSNSRKGPPPEQLVFVCALPLYHIFALTVCGLLGLRTGGMNILIPNPRDLPAVAKALKGQPFHLFPAVNTLYNALEQNEEFRKLDFSGLRISMGGGMAVQKAVADRWLKLTGCPICEGYGLSETSPVATANPVTTEAYTGTIGLPIPSTEVAILDDDGKPVPLGQRGEIAIRGPQVMAGYWQQPAETARVMTADGFFKTGDIGVMDERGFVKIVDRKKDMILVSGFNVYPNEVEDVVAMHPGVLECAAVGVPDERSGEAVKLFVVKRDPALTEKDVLDHCAAQLTNYKRPKHVEFRSELPKTNVGKILRRELRDQAVRAAA
ncbi:MAG TPA: long-chain-fatty-acid--CoA ligase [Burkholderiaceae bacterium]|jgi:long-chain acyl-CoA synthetase|nr:long-chain-fatty-acid--CoA ligase [Burkholderiaceae bacterium]